MNSTTTIVGGIAAIAIIGGLVYFLTRDTGLFSPTATSTPSGSVNTSSGGTNGEPSVPTPAAEPSAPSVTTNASAAMTDTTAVVSGSVNPNGALTTYWYEYGTTQNLGQKSANQSIGSGVRTLPAPGFITNLSKDTTYFFRLVAENAKGKTSGAIQTMKTTVGTPPPVGQAPSVQTSAASGVGRTAATLNGSVNPNQAATSYWFEYGTTPSLGNVSALTAVGSGASRLAASVALGDLAPGTTHYFRLNAQNQFGTVNGAILNFRTDNPAASAAPSVSTRSATDVGTTTATLRATVDPNGIETTYWFEYSTDSLLGSVLLSTTGQKSAGPGTNAVQVETDVSSLAPNTTYYFRAVAQNSQGVVRGERLTFKTK
ncbi:MAG TPA: hypothetical protein VD967_02830 [Candidatus Paceibacterota bacterium]|nr:hypothetical protein [Candidatus Paceibacterota bacterium]